MRRFEVITTIQCLEAFDEPVIYRTEVLAIIGALADLLVELRAIRDLLKDEGEEEE